MKAISIWQPWATLVAIGRKRVETRAWSTSYRGPIAIHAARRWDSKLSCMCRTYKPIRDALCTDLEIARRIEAPEELARGVDPFLPLGCIVATARLVACLPTPRVITDPCATITLADPRRLPEADPMAYALTPEEQALGNYEPNRWAWVLEGIAALRTPIPYRGAQGLFKIPDDIFEEPRS